MRAGGMDDLRLRRENATDLVHLALTNQSQERSHCLVIDRKPAWWQVDAECAFDLLDMPPELAPTIEPILTGECKLDIRQSLRWILLA